MVDLLWSLLYISPWSGTRPWPWTTFPAECSGSRSGWLTLTSFLTNWELCAPSWTPPHFQPPLRRPRKFSESELCFAKNIPNFTLNNNGHCSVSRLFLSRHLSDSLLILDDVWRPEVIKTFTLPVRILVTTQDVSVMETVRGHYSVVEIRWESTSWQQFSIIWRITFSRNKSIWHSYKLFHGS